MKRRLCYLLTGSALAIMVFILGVLAGVLQAGKWEYLSSNLDLSDWLSALIILMLLVALRLSLTSPPPHPPHKTERFPMNKPLSLSSLIIALSLSWLSSQSTWAYSSSWPPVGDTEMLSGRDITLGSTQLTSSAAGRDMNLQGTRVNGIATAGRDIRGQGCKGTASFRAGRDMQLAQCHSVISASAGRNMELVEVEIKQDIASGKDLVIQHSKIAGNAKVGGDVYLQDAEIQGILHVALPYLLVNRSKLGGVRVSQPLMAFSGNGIVVGHGNIVSSNGSSIISSGGSNVVSTNGQTVISVKANSTSSVNGYTVQGGMGETTVITPDGTVYLNGTWVSGPGPKTYGEYKSQTPSAPTIIGPGWQDTGSSYPIPKTSLPPQAQQVVELKNNSRVIGPIIFESGQGKVLVHKNAVFSGQVQGGVVEHIDSE